MQEVIQNSSRIYFTWDFYTKIKLSKIDYLQAWAKYFAKSYKTKQNYLYNFWLLLSKIHFWRRGWALACVSTQFWDFPDISSFLRSYSMRQLMQQPINKVYDTRYQVLLHLWGFKHVLEHNKSPKYYDQSCRSFHKMVD